MQIEAPLRRLEQPRNRTCVQAPPHVREAVHNILVGHMAAHLSLHRVALKDRASVRTELLQAGFGEGSVTTLLDRVIEAAR